MSPTALSTVQWCSPPTRPGADSSEAPTWPQLANPGPKQERGQSTCCGVLLPYPFSKLLPNKEALVRGKPKQHFWPFEPYVRVCNGQTISSLCWEKPVLRKGTPRGGSLVFLCSQMLRFLCSTALCANSRRGKEGGHLLFWCNFRRSTDSKFQHVPKQVTCCMGEAEGFHRGGNLVITSSRGCGGIRFYSFYCTKF